MRCFCSAGQELERADISRPDFVFRYSVTTRRHAAFYALYVQGSVLGRDPAQRQSLQFWLDDFVRPWLFERILPVSEVIAETTGRIAGERDTEGRPLSFPDAAIAATAIENAFTLVTRNIKDFANLPVPILSILSKRLHSAGRFRQ